MTISELVNRAHDNAVKHGFWEPAPELGTAIALIHSELSEALEEEREGNAVMYFHDCVTGEAKTDVAELRDDHSGRFKPEGLASELADVVIRTADLCGHLGIDLETVIRLKMDFNETRPYKHGKKF